MTFCVLIANEKVTGPRGTKVFAEISVKCIIKIKKNICGSDTKY